MNINVFIKKFNKELKKKIKDGFVREEYFTTWDYNRQSEVHSRIQAIIAKIYFEMGFDIEMERGFEYKNNKRFKPDISLYKNNKLIAFVEYESTNSSDSRFYDCKQKTSVLHNLKEYCPTDEKRKPKAWVIIFTLPKTPVTKPSWKITNLKCNFKGSQKEVDNFLRSPSKYFFPRYIKETKKALQKIYTPTEVFLLNINKNRIYLEKRIKVHD